MQDLAYYENRVSEAQEKVDKLAAQGYAHFLIPQVYGSESNFIQHDGKELTEKQYEKRLDYCKEMKAYEIIPFTLRCGDWVLTFEGENMIVTYMFFGKKMDN